MARSASRKQKKKKVVTIPPEIRKRFFTRKDALLVLTVIIFSFILNLIGFGWGMDGQVPWAADGIEGITTVREMPKLYGQWTYKYPRLQFLINSLCYKPWISNWEENPVTVQYNGQQRKQIYTLERLNTLAIVSRIVILVMSSVIILFIYLIARFYYADSIAAFAASLSLSVCFIFVYYSHTTCVDIPSMLWITLGVYFLIRSIYLNKMGGHILMGLFFAFACCTKDAMLAYAAAFAIVYIVLFLQRRHQKGVAFKQCLLSLINRNVFIAIIIFIFTFALLQNILISPKAYWERMGVWIGGRGVKDFNQGFKGQWHQLWNTLKMFYWSCGWPLLGLAVASLAYTMKKHRFFNLLIILFPLVFFYVFIAMRIKMSFIRYYLPVMGLLFLPIGAMISELIHSERKQLFKVLISVISCVFVLSLVYCIALDLELIYDSRNQTAEWFKTNVRKNTPVLSLMNRPYGPNLDQAGYPMIEHWSVPDLNTFLQNQRRMPDYFVLSTGWHTLKSDNALKLRKALLQGQTEYTEVARFTQTGYIVSKKNVLSIAAWPLKANLAISPSVVVMKKDSSE